MTWTTDHSILLVHAYLGYAIETGPRGIIRCRDSERTFPLPDFPHDAAEIAKVEEVWLGRGAQRAVVSRWLAEPRLYRVELVDPFNAVRPLFPCHFSTITAAKAWAFWRVAR